MEPDGNDGDGNRGFCLVDKDSSFFSVVKANRGIDNETLDLLLLTDSIIFVGAQAWTPSALIIKSKEIHATNSSVKFVLLLVLCLMEKHGVST